MYNGVIFIDSVTRNSLTSVEQVICNFCLLSILSVVFVCWVYTKFSLRILSIHSEYLVLHWEYLVTLRILSVHSEYLVYTQNT